MTSLKNIVAGDGIVAGELVYDIVSPMAELQVSARFLCLAPLWKQKVIDIVYETTKLISSALINNIND